MDRNACLQNGWYNRVRRGGYQFFGQGAEDRHIAVRERFIGRVDSCTYGWKAEVIDERGYVGSVLAIVDYAVDAETEVMLA